MSDLSFLNIDNDAEMLDHEQVKLMIPHRFPMLMVDKVVNIHKAKSAIGIKNVSAGEPFFSGHFPSQAVMPGVMMVESMAQTAGVLVVYSLGVEAQGKLVYFMSIDDARFRKLVVPGDQLKIHVEIQKNRANVWKFSGVCYVDEAKVCEATFSAMIVDKPKVV